MGKERGRSKAKEIKICSACGRPTKKLFNKLCKKCLGTGDALEEFYRDKKKGNNKPEIHPFF